ncbi:GNAT family N-acetyltransferase [Cohnella zeiphila]|uniref:GNAT family N-acetyltransferase n=1 Tax=Cohnella zeiphila TaxID=2761120 RepID=A0A7X0SS36_9BACL|nr:GNAT family N-acetyltransferase [Cohnella zeiphila]MBB6735091.1 GNAT family N-acetyltransferase [Cohnella zeiphila]
MQIRQLRSEEEWKEAVKLSDLVFRDPEHISMGEAFPTVFSASLGQSFGAWEEEKLVSFVGLVPFVIRVGAARLKVYAIGSVCTHPDFRGKGHAGAILEQVNRHIRNAGASLLLVSGDRPLYQRIHCYPFGGFNRYSLKPEQASALSGGGWKVRERTSEDLFVLQDLAEERAVRYEQSVTELADLIQARAYASCLKLEHRTLVAEKDGRAAAFAVLAVPGAAKSHGTPRVIEWAGDPSAVVSIVADALGRYGLDSLDMAVSWHENGMLETLRDVPFEEGRNSGTVRVTDPRLLMEQLAPYWREKAGSEAASLTAELSEDGGCVLTLGTDSVRVTARELISLLFDPKPQLSEPLAQAIADRFPIPLPYTEGLNMV